MPFQNHSFTSYIKEALADNFQEKSETIFEKSELIQYLNVKTKAANRGSKSRVGLGNHYALYVLIEDYIKKNYHISGNYKKYEGAKFKDLFNRQRELPFGAKLQNHALNHRLNQEFKKYFPACDYQPIIRDVQSNRYWINENLLTIDIDGCVFNIANAVEVIITKYIEVRKGSFSEFLECCQKLLKMEEEAPEVLVEFVAKLFSPNSDARFFEIASFAVLKFYYQDQEIYWGRSPQDLIKENLTLYKTGRTNANDGGIDFVMKPLGRFFQVTETIDAGKYFLDIDKIQRYPITFVVKTDESIDVLMQKIRDRAEAKYTIHSVVEKYIEAIDEIINTPKLLEILKELSKQSLTKKVIQEIVTWSRLEFNLEAEDSGVFC